jgi:hypothetical protein
MQDQAPIFIVRLIGGLGNQLFQMQYGLGLIKKWGGTLYFDDSFFLRAKQAHEFLAVEIFRKNNKAITLGAFTLKVNRSFQRLAYKLGLCLPEVFSPYYLFSNINYLKLTSKTYIVDGFWQSKDYLSEEFLGLIRDQMALSSSNEESTKICVHIRRGDYLINPNALTLDSEYYDKAINLLAKNIQNPQFHIFSDDESWVEAKFSGDSRITVVQTSNLKPLELLKRMAAYQNFIIANSTLSWWAANLSMANKKTVIMPKHWGNGLDSYNFALDGWIKL